MKVFYNRMVKSALTHATLDHGSRPRVGAVARALVRMIHSTQPREGDRLPSQATLRARCGFSNDVLSPAMQLLTDHGLITRQRKVGTVIVDPERPVHDLWRIGIAPVHAITSETFYAQLLNLVQIHLQAAGARVTLFLMPSGAHRNQGFKLTHWTRLAEACEAGQLDGLIAIAMIDGEDWEYHRRRGLEIAHAGSWELAPAGAVIDQSRMVRESVRLLHERGCRRIGMVAQGPPCQGYERFWTGLRAGAAAVGLAEPNVRGWYGGLGAAGGWRVGEQLLAVPAAERPDGLVIAEDRLANGLTAALVGGDSRYRPQIVVQTNRQAPLAFALPVIHFDVDLDELARRAVTNLMRRVRGQATALEREWVYPRLASDQSQQLNVFPAGAASGFGAINQMAEATVAADASQ